MSSMLIKNGQPFPTWNLTHFKTLKKSTYMRIITEIVSEEMKHNKMKSTWKTKQKYTNTYGAPEWLRR